MFFSLLQQKPIRLLQDAEVKMVAIRQNLGRATPEMPLRYIGNLEIAQRQPPSILRCLMN